LSFNLVVMRNQQASGMSWVEPNICLAGVGRLQCFENIVSGVAHADRLAAHA